MGVLKKLADNKFVDTIEMNDDPEITIMRNTKVGLHGES